MLLLLFLGIPLCHLSLWIQSGAFFSYQILRSELLVCFLPESGDTERQSCIYAVVQHLVLSFVFGRIGELAPESSEREFSRIWHISVVLLPPSGCSDTSTYSKLKPVVVFRTRCYIMCYFSFNFGYSDLCRIFGAKKKKRRVVHLKESTKRSTNLFCILLNLSQLCYTFASDRNLQPNLVFSPSGVAGYSLCSQVS